MAGVVDMLMGSPAVRSFAPSPAHRCGGCGPVALSSTVSPHPPPTLRSSQPPPLHSPMRGSRPSDRISALSSSVSRAALYWSPWRVVGVVWCGGWVVWRRVGGCACVRARLPGGTGLDGNRHTAERWRSMAGAIRHAPLLATSTYLLLDVVGLNVGIHLPLLQHTANNHPLTAPTAGPPSSGCG